MYIYNITFVIIPDREPDFIRWVRHEAIPALFGEETGAYSPRLQTVVEAGGEKPKPDHGLSIALQAEFPSEGAAHEWHDSRLPDVVGAFMRTFGPDAAFFTTLLLASEL